jgi:PAS domain S-box-containing protein
VIRIARRAQQEHSVTFRLEGEGALSLPAGIDERTVFRSLFSAYPDAMLLVDAGGTIVLSNPAAAALLAYSNEELAGMNVDALVPASTRPRHAAWRADYMRRPVPRPMGTQMDLVAKCGDGREVMVEISLSPLPGRGLPLVVVAIRDVGAYPRVQRALESARYSEQLAQMGRLAVHERDSRIVLEHAPRIAAEALQLKVALVTLLEPDGAHFRVVSGFGLQSWHRIGARVPNTPDTLPGYMLEHPQPLVLPDYRHETRFELPRPLVESSLTCGVVVPLSDRGRTFGTLTVHSHQPRIFGEDELRFLESLCSLLATSVQRAHTEEALNHSQRLETVGQLTGGIAHDFNNLLTVIQGNLQFLEETPGLEGDAHGRRLLAAATRATLRAAELTGKLLAFSRRQVLQPALVEVAPVLHSLADMLRRTLDQRVRIELEVEAGCPPVLADPVQLEAAILNVAINARDAMSEGGRLVFAAGTTPRLPEGLVGDATAAPVPPEAGYVSIAITDSGSGMSDEVRERAFEPFFTTKAAGRGTGLGLSTVYGFVRQSHGGVAIASAPGAGTTVTLYLPRHRGVPDEPADAMPPFEPLPPGLRVLLVEDDPAVRTVAVAMLESLDARTTACATAEEALLHLSDPGGFDLLATDVALGAGMRGTDLAREAQRRLPSLAVLLVSGFSAELIDADRVAPLDWELVPKPYTRADLARAMATALGQAPRPGADA